MPNPIVVKDIPPFTTRNIRYSALVAGDAPFGTMANVATITSHETAPITRGVASTLGALTSDNGSGTYKSVSPTGTVKPGQILTYTIRVRNNNGTTPVSGGGSRMSISWQ